MRQTRPLYALTYHGSFLCYDTEARRLVHRTLAARQPHEVLAEVHPDLDVAHGAPVASVVFTTPAAVAALGDRADGAAWPLGRYEIVPALRGRLCSFRRDGLFICAEAEGVCPADRPAAHDWESFLLLDERQMAALMHLAGNPWVTDVPGAPVPAAAIGFAEDFGFRVGTAHYDLALGHPLGGVRTADFRSCVLLQDGWRVAGEAVLYRPLVYFTAFGEDAVFEQLRWSVTSLLRAGGYDGQVHVISDRPRGFIDRYMPEGVRERYSLQFFPAEDFFDYCIARYAILDWPEAARYQPLLYADTDVAFDAPVASWLAGIVRGDLVHAAPEYFSSLRTHDSVGSRMLAEAGHDPGDATGFNAGVLAFPSVAACGDTLRLIADVAKGWRTRFGGDPGFGGDQPAANYVLHVRGLIGLRALADVVRIAGAAPMTELGERKGFVHFWQARSQVGKAQAMADYVHLLLQADGTD